MFNWLINLYTGATNLYTRVFRPNTFLENSPEVKRLKQEIEQIGIKYNQLERITRRQSISLNKRRRKVIGLESGKRVLEKRISETEKEAKRSLFKVLSSFENIPCIYTDLNFNPLYTNPKAHELIKKKGFSQESQRWNKVRVIDGYVFTSELTFAKVLQKLYQSSFGILEDKKPLPNSLQEPSQA